MRLLGLSLALLFLSSQAFATEKAAGYLSLAALSEASHLSLNWDPIFKNASVQNGSVSAKFHIGSEYALMNGRIRKLCKKAILYKDEILISQDALPYLYSQPIVPKTVEKSAEPAMRKIRRIVVDAGHGGKDFGATSKRGTVEKDLALDVSFKLRRELEALGFEVILSRSSDVFISLQDRAKLPMIKSADLFISVHANASLDKKLSGFEVYYLSEATDDNALAVERAENASLRYEKDSSFGPGQSAKEIYWDLRQTENRRQSIQISQFITNRVDESTEISAKRVRSAGFYVLKWAESPSVLIEIGYITNSQDERRLKDQSYRYELAHGIAQGILDYAKEYERTEAFTQ